MIDGKIVLVDGARTPIGDFGGRMGIGGGPALAALFRRFH